MLRIFDLIVLSCTGTFCKSDGGETKFQEALTVVGFS